MLFAGSGNWFATNFSLRAVLSLEHYRAFVVWSVLAGGYFYVLLTGLALNICARWLRRSVHAVAMTSCVMLGYAVFIPYLPDQIPRWVTLHVVLAAGACVMVMGGLLLLLLYFRERRLLALWGVIAGVSGILLAVGGQVTSALEVFFCLSAGGLLRILWKKHSAFHGRCL